ncbi:MAG TPA: helix-turn-helix transcriptional regulator [Acidimicrobiales bacterium]
MAGSPGPSARDVGRAQLERLGRVIREQRNQAEMSLRDLAARTNVSNPYLSQLERGLHEPSVRVLKAIAHALNMSAEALMVQAGMLDGPARAEPAVTVADAVRADPRLTEEQRAALLTVYRSYIDANPPIGDTEPDRPADSVEAGGATADDA